MTTSPSSSRSALECGSPLPLSVNQPDLFQSAKPAPPPPTTDPEILRAHLSYYKSFRTRAQVCSSFGWTERQLRDAAEQLGAEIVRCQAGYKLTADIQRDDLPLVIQAIDAFISQAKKMLRYAVALKRRLHQMFG